MNSIKARWFVTKTHTNKIYQIREVLPIEENFVHENFIPAIISKEKWEQVQSIFGQKKKKNVRASSGKPCHRYTGLLRCDECGCTFVCKIRRWTGLPDRYEYNCNGYHRYGKEYCTAHRIDEAMLDELIYSELLSIQALFSRLLPKTKPSGSSFKRCTI